ncbi:MAG: glucose-6-phosphate isomerase, partial [Bacteroidales bacterium]|nr:glucose-6-phosphate isomerase [Bacteroidales bacterium]
MIKVNDQHLLTKIDYKSYQDRVIAINKMIDEKTGPGNDFLGWLNYPDTYNKEEFERIIKDAEYVRDNFDVLVVCGIGGSYLGARAGIEALNGLHSTKKPEIIFLGQTFSSDYIYETINYIKDKKFAINVISKSGTTTETAISFRLLKELLEKKVGKEAAAKAIFATTDAEKGALKTLSSIEGYETYVLPGDVGGRYSVFTAVGLFPLAV